MLLIEQLKNTSYKEQLLLLYNCGFAPDGPTGTRKTIIMENKETKQSLILLKEV